MPDTVKDLLKQALKFTADSKLDKAIEVYRAILKQTPKDTRVLNNLGDLYLKKNNNAEAVKIFQQLGTLFDADGWTVKAIAMCQKVLKIDSGQLDTKAFLGDLCAKQKMIGDARQYYFELANIYDKKGDIKKALTIFGKLADLDPGNIAVRTKLGNMYFKEKMLPQAVEAWARAAEACLTAGKTEDAAKLLARVLEVEPKNLRAALLVAGQEAKAGQPQKALEHLRPVREAGMADGDFLKVYSSVLIKLRIDDEAIGVLRKLVERDPTLTTSREQLGLVLLRAGQAQEGAELLMKLVGEHHKENRWDRAEALILEVRNASPDDPAVLQKLVEIRTQSGKTAGLIEAYRDLGSLYERKGLPTNARGVYGKLAQLDPGNPEWGRLAGAGGETFAAAPPPPPPEETAGEVDFDKIPLLTEADEEELTLVEEGEAAPPAATSSLGSAQRLLAQGHFSDAEKELNRLVLQSPSVEALNLLKELYRQQNRSTGQVKICFELATIHRKAGRIADATDQYREILSIDRKNQQAKNALADLVVTYGPEDLEQVPSGKTAPVTIPEGVVEFDEDEIELDDSLLDMPVLGREAESALEPSATLIGAEGLEPGLTEPIPAMASVDEEWAEAEFYFQQGLVDEAEVACRAILDKNPGHAGAADRLRKLEAGRKKAEAPPPPPSPSQEPEVLVINQKDLEDFGRNLDVEMPQPKQKSKMTIRGGEAAPAAAAPSGDFSSFLDDLRTELEKPPVPASTFEDESLRDIFQEFQQSVRENLPEEDYETHYNLGIAYKEMGLLDEALTEFDLAARSPAFFTDAVSMTALIFKERGDMGAAMQAFLSALARLGQDDVARKGLLWELAELYEDMGNHDKAVELYLSIYELDSEFQSIQDKLRELGVMDRIAGEASLIEPVGVTVQKPAVQPPVKEPPPEAPKPRAKAKVSYL